MVTCIQGGLTARYIMHKSVQACSIVKVVIAWYVRTFPQACSCQYTDSSLMHSKSLPEQALIICAMWRKSGLATWDYLTVLHKKIIHLIWGVKSTSVTQRHNNNNGTCISTLYVRTSFKKSLARKLILFHVKQVCRISYTEKTNGFF